MRKAVLVAFAMLVGVSAAQAEKVSIRFTGVSDQGATKIGKALAGTAKVGGSAKTGSMRITADINPNDTSLGDIAKTAHQIGDRAPLILRLELRASKKAIADKTITPKALNDALKGVKGVREADYGNDVNVILDPKGGASLGEIKKALAAFVD